MRNMFQCFKCGISLICATPTHKISRLKKREEIKWNEKVDVAIELFVVVFTSSIDPWNIYIKLSYDLRIL